MYKRSEIKMSNDSGNWLPYNLDGTAHECRESTTKKSNNKTVANMTTTETDSMAKPQQQTSTIKLTLTLESLDQRIKNIEESFDMRIKKIEAILFRD